MLRSGTMVEGSLRHRRRSLLDRDLGGSSFCRSYAAEADLWLSGLADRACGGDTRHLALLAVGGYGRGELCPYSDLDVVLVHDGRRDVGGIAESIWYPIWDEGVRLDHSVRRPAEVLGAAGTDLRVAMGLLDARLVWGEEKVGEPLLAQVLELWRKELGQKWLPELARQTEERRRTQGDVAFLLEPDLKESHGGLRDVNILRAMAAYAPQLNDYVDLASLEPAVATLTAVRVELHRGAGRELDRLLLQEQDHVAENLGLSDADDLMASVAEAGRAISWVSDDAWRRRQLWQPTKRRRGWAKLTRSPRAGDDTEPQNPETVEPGVIVAGGEAGLAPDAAVAADSSIPFRLAAVAAERDLPIARDALLRLSEILAPPPAPWPDETRRALVRVLAAGPPSVDALEALDQRGLLVRLLPEWSSVRNKPQRNAYHRFTVDRHLLEAAANAAALTDRVERPDLLLVGALLHDIGKGYPGDHTDAGIVVVGEIATRMGFPPADVATLVTMCRLHLSLPDTATRRDLDDPATVETVARSVGDVATLRLLAALTEADGLATGPAAWGSWKAGLLDELVERTAAYLEDRGVPVGRPGGGSITESVRRATLQARAQHRPVVSLDPPNVVIAAPDRPGLLASAAGVLALHGLDVKSADASGETGMAIEVFTVAAPRLRWPDEARLREDLESVLAGRLGLSERLASKAEAYATKRPSSARAIVPTVVVDNDASATSTVVEVTAPDELGLLHRVTRALFACDLDVISARVSTFGDEVVDAFYVRHTGGGKVTAQPAIENIERSVAAIAAPPDPSPS